MSSSHGQAWFCGGCTVAFDVELDLGPLVDVRVASVECPHCGQEAVRVDDVLQDLELEQTGLWIESTLSEIEGVLRDRRVPKPARLSLRRLERDLRERASEAARRRTTVAPLRELVHAGAAASPVEPPAVSVPPSVGRNCSGCGIRMLDPAELCGFCKRGWS